MEQLKPMYLPLELVLNVITCSLPKPNVLLAPSHPITQLLLTFTLVCKETRQLANKYLLQHCLYFSHRRRLSSYLSTIRSRPELGNVTAVFLAPFLNRGRIDDYPTSCAVRELFQLTCRTLKRCIIDMPLARGNEAYSGASDRCDHALLDGLKLLENLEEFVSVRGGTSLALNPSHTLDLSTHWKRLKRLAVYYPYVKDEFWWRLAKIPALETVVLTRAHGLRGFRESNIKREYFRYSQTPYPGEINPGTEVASSYSSYCQRPIKVIFLNVEEEQVNFYRFPRADWDEADPERKMTIMTYSIPLLFEGDDPGEVCQNYVRMGAENATLWDWEGEIIQHPPQLRHG
jgi:hypothetical protein